MAISLQQMRPTSVAAQPLTKALDAISATLAVAGNSVPITDIKVAGVSVDSLDIETGEVFVAIPGLRFHGARFAAGAVAAGATAIVTDEAGVQHCADLGVPVAVVADPRAAAGLLAAFVYDHPSRKLRTLGITGTNGKTTTSYFIRSGLLAAGEDPALVGTVEMRVGDLVVESKATTMEAPVLHRVLALAVEKGCQSAIIEVSSHAVALGRIAGIHFDVAAFTNLQHDHLDFHGTMAEYFAAKAELFSAERTRAAVVCVDSEWGKKLAQQVAQTDVALTTVRATAVEGEAEWCVTEIAPNPKTGMTDFVLVGPAGQRQPVQCGVPGSVNVQNAAVAALTVANIGIPLSTIADGLATDLQVPGRMERVGRRELGEPLCIVDYAHTPEALTWALGAVRELTPGRLIVVFGADGDRDRTKRPLLGEVAAELADDLFVTDENPRSEEPGTIRAAILAGVRQQRPELENVVEITTSRAEAIAQAVALAQVTDTVIVTGKGSEPFQEIAGKMYRYNDVPVMAAAVAQWRSDNL